MPIVLDLKIRASTSKTTMHGLEEIRNVKIIRILISTKTYTLCVRLTSLGAEKKDNNWNYRKKSQNCRNRNRLKTAELLVLFIR